MTKAETALQLFSGQCNCAQALLATFGTDEGLSFQDCLRIAAPFGGGIARMGQTCGAVSGAIMVLGLRYGKQAAGDPQAKAALYERVGEFVSRFQGCHNSIICRELLGIDVSTPEGWKQAQDQKVHETLCPDFVRVAAEILEEVLLS